MNDSRPKHPNQSPDDQLESAFLVPKNFSFGPVTVAHSGGSAGIHALVEVREPEEPPPPLGPLEKFSGTFTGNGFNAIFRPQSTQTPTFSTKQVPEVAGVPRDNVLQLNLTKETLSFSRAEDLKNVPNRGMVQGDIFFAGVSYMQFIQDVTGLDHNNEEPGIHLEPGLWMFVGETTTPTQGTTLMRMGSVPHGTSFLAQGMISSTQHGPPTDFPECGSLRSTPTPAKKSRSRCSQAWMPRTA